MSCLQLSTTNFFPLRFYLIDAPVNWGKESIFENLHTELKNKADLLHNNFEYHLEFVAERRFSTFIILFKLKHINVIIGSTMV